MGIPKFFRLISERWPLISQEILVSEEIEYDNLYLDMNSILHNCTHSNDGEISRLTDEQMFGAIFAYIDYLFNLIKPKKTFYMAIDGVAPRAKMNQQRARRFRSAIEAEELMKKAIDAGEPIPKDEAFDTNAITPGTDFMAKVTENLKFYINQKVSNDKQWQDIEIILSGHEVPGEGEHKIMEYIRVQKAQPEYNPNMRHCVYGLDADLIILGLVAHEPHFSILREEVVFGRNKKSSSDLTSQKFFLLHISLVRNYLQREFESLSDEISFEYDFEKILDDLILILYVIGNDFLPNLPDLHFNKGAFPLLLQTFKEAMKRTDGYLNENGVINLKRLGIWLDILAIFELENFEEGDVDIEWFNKQLDNVSRKGERKRKKQGKELLIKEQKKMAGLIGNWLLKIYHESFDVKKFLSDETQIPQLQIATEFFSSDLNREFIQNFVSELGLFIVHSKSADTYIVKLDVDGINPDETEEEFNERLVEIKQSLRKYQSGIVLEDEQTLKSGESLYNEKFSTWKDKYYQNKLGFSIENEEEITKITENYIEGLQWVLHYYYHGICAWPWYYKYHYAPRISDLAKGLKVQFNFELGEPFTPYEQLMSVLPERSKALIPACYRHLMTDEDSPIKDFYPSDCAVDKNGKSASWEAVVLLSFVDEKRLKEAMEPLKPQLNAIERQRNSFGHNLIFKYNPQVNKLIKSPLPSAFPDFDSHATEVQYNLPSMNGKEIIIGLIPGVKTGIDMLAGFPTLNSIPHTAKLQPDQLVVFQQPARSESMILILENEFENLSPEQFAQLYCDKIVYANWPYLKEYKVVYVMDSLMKYEMSKSGDKVFSSPVENFEMSQYQHDVADINYMMHRKKGLRFTKKDIADEIISENHKDDPNTIKEPIDGLVYAKKVIGVTPNSEGKLVKVLSDVIEVFPTQLIVPTIKNIDPRFEEKEPAPIEEEYPTGSSVVFLGKMGYGTPATVVGTENNTLAISFIKQNGPEPIFGSSALKVEQQSIIYHSAYESAKILGLNTYFLSRITSNYMVIANSKKINIGLSLKFEGKGIKTLGYTRKSGQHWEYSDIAIGLIRDYKHTFPELFQAVMKFQGNNMPDVKNLFPHFEKDNLSAMLRDIKDFLLNKQLNFTQVSLHSDSFSKHSIAKIEKQIIEYVQTPQDTTAVQIKNIPRVAVLNPSVPVLKLKHQQFRLGDRVMYILDSGKVALFSKGTVIGYRSSETAVSVHVLFDTPILSGNRFDGRLETQRGLSIDSACLLNLTLRHYSYPPPKPNAKNTSFAKKPITEMSKARQSKNAVRNEQNVPKTPKTTKAPKASKESKKNSKEDVAAEAERKKIVIAKRESKKELLTIIKKKENKETETGNSSIVAEEPPNATDSDAKSVKNTAAATASVPSSNDTDAKKLLNMLVSNALTPSTNSTTSQQVPQPPMAPHVMFPGMPMGMPPMNGNPFPGMQFAPMPPMNGNPFPGMQFAPMPMYPYMPTGPMPGMPMMNGMPPPPNVGAARPTGAAKPVPKPAHKAAVQIDSATSEKVLNSLRGDQADGTTGDDDEKKKKNRKPRQKRNNKKSTSKDAPVNTASEAPTPAEV